MFLILNEHGNYNLKTNFLFFFVSIRFVFIAVSELIFFKTVVSSVGFKFLQTADFVRLQFLFFHF